MLRVLRAVLGGLLWILAALVGLLGVISCVTLILLPVGIPLLMLARRLFAKSIRLFMPPVVAHPVKEAGRGGRKAGRSVEKLGKKARRKITDKAGSSDLDLSGAKRKTSKFLSRQRKRVA